MSALEVSAQNRSFHQPAAMASECVWQQHAALFRRLYLTENRTLKNVKEIAEEQFGFPENRLSTYETKLRDVLRLRKNLTPEGWIAIDQKIRTAQTRDWEVYINGRKASTRKVLKEIGRYAKRGRHSIRPGLSLPDGVEIKWPPTLASHPSEAMPGRLVPELTVRETRSEVVIDNTGTEWVDMTGCDMLIVPGSPSGVLDSAKFLWYQRPEIIDQTVGLEAGAKRTISSEFSAAILEPRLAKLWEPMLDNLPVLRLKNTLGHFCQSYGTYSSAGIKPNNILVQSRSLTSPQSIASFKLPRNHTDTVTVHTWGPSSGTDIPYPTQAHYELDVSMDIPLTGEVSTMLNPFHILSLTLYYLSNGFEGLGQVRETILFLIERVQPDLQYEFLRSGSSAVEESWIRLVEWSFELDEKRFFEQIMQVTLDRSDWVHLHGAECLVFAAYFDSAGVATKIMEHGTSPDEMAEFKIPTLEDTSMVGFAHLAAAQYRRLMVDSAPVRTFPLLEAAARGSLTTLGVLKKAGAAYSLRSYGFTAAGHTLGAYSRGAIDEETYHLTLAFLVDSGEDIDAPIWEESDKTREYNEPHCLWSEETLLDMVYLLDGGGSSVYQYLLQRSHVSDCVLTVSGILRSATIGPDALNRYMSTATYPRGLPRLRIAQVAFMRSLKIPKALEVMVASDFPLGGKGILYPRYPTPGADDLLEKIDEVYVGGIGGLLPGLISCSAYVQQYILERVTEEDLTDYIGDNLTEASAFISLLESDPDLLSRFGTELVACLTRENRLNDVRRLLEAGADPNWRAEDYALPMLLLAAGQWALTVDMLNLLYEHGARTGPWRITELKKHLATRRTFGIPQLLWILKHGLDLGGESVYSIVVSLLRPATPSEELPSLAKCLAKRGYPIIPCQQYELKGDVPYLGVLIYLTGSADLILQFLDKGSRSLVDQPSFNYGEGYAPWRHHTPLMAAVRIGNLSSVKELIDRGACIDKRIGSSTALQSSISLFTSPTTIDKVAYKNIAFYLLEKGANPNLYSTSGPSGKQNESPLVIALQSPTPDRHLVQMLIERGSNVNVSMTGRNGKSSTLSEVVLEKKDIDLEQKLELVNLLHAGKAKMDFSRSLFWACEDGDIEVMKWCLDQGANPNSVFATKLVDTRTFTPLYMSARKGDIPMALILLANGATTLSGDDGPLSIAAEYGRLDMVALLLTLEQRPGEVERALDSAREARYYSMIKLLKAHLERD
ncbi:putative Clr5 domain-containing protein [Seiridium unicorne]|uniref:Clr5 domain-containing protein n=1 Tax=Seiridium unicorne TaxID=138068 RepID=A0ABR2VGR7_9PEZI